MMTRIAILTVLLISFAGCAETTPSSTGAGNPPTSSGSSSVAADTASTDDTQPQRAAIVTLTDAAVAKAREFQKQGDKPYLRVAVSGLGSAAPAYHLHFDNQIDADDDYLDEAHGLKVVVDRKSASYLVGTSIDWRRSDDGREGFYFDHPNELSE